MNSSDSRQVLGRLGEGEFFDRELALGQLRAIATSGKRPQPGSIQPRPRRAPNALVVGAPRVGKTAVLRECFDQLFNLREDVAPFYYALKPYCLEVDGFARDYLSQFLSQFIAFRKDEPGLIAAADEPLAAIARAALPEDYLWVQGLVDSFARAAQSGDAAILVRCALSAPAIASSRARIAPFILVDNFHLLAEAAGRGSILPTEFLRVLEANESISPAIGSAGSQAPTYALCGLRRPVLDLIPGDELIRGLEIINIEQLPEAELERVIRSTAASLGVETSDSTVDLLAHQLKGDLFYVRALLEAAASSGGGLKTFMEVERAYTDEVLSGRICRYLDALLREVSPDLGARRAALEVLSLVVEAKAAVPLETVTELLGEHTGEVGRVLGRLHDRELLEISYGFVTASADSVLADYVRAKYRSEIVGAPRPVSGDELLGEKLKESYRLMMSRYNRAVEEQLVESLSHFDFQSVPESLFDAQTFEKAHRGMSRVQARRALGEEKGRVRLPQIVLVNDAGSGEATGVRWTLFAATGFEGGIYSEANEVLWLIALINGKEPLDLETLGRIEQKLKTVGRGMSGRAAVPSRRVRWYISKEGFSAAATERLKVIEGYSSTYDQLDLLQDHLINLGVRDERRPASEIELVIPIENEAELIAARTVEQVARAADFGQEAINQIKTALIEACINAAEHSDSPDRRIYQRFAIDDDRLIITVSNKGKKFSSAERDFGEPAPAGLLKGSRGRGLQIIRALMDEVRFQPTDDGTSLTMIKYLKSPRRREE
jgi:serine/threonine-protein kinase RsbW